MAPRTISLSAVAQSGRAVEAVAQSGSADRAQLSPRIAEALQYLGPFPLYACLLVGPESPSLSALDESGSPRPDWEPALLKVLRGEAPRNGEPITPADGLPGDYLCVAPVVFQNRRYGALALGSARGGAEEVQASLDLVAQRLAAQLQAQDHGQADAERSEWLANVSETASIVAHEFNNYLNGMMLHLALLKQEAPKAMSAELDVMKRLAMDAAALVKRLQEYNGRRRPTLMSTDLNDAVRDALDRIPLPPGVAGINYHLAENLPRVGAARREFGRLLALLMRQAGAAMQAKPGPIIIRTEAAGRKVLLRFEDSGPSLESDVLTRIFEPFFIARRGTEEPGLALCHTLARRLHAGMRAENRPEGGVAFILEFTPAVTPLT
jgi:signal transduction histidine kinase